MNVTVHNLSTGQQLTYEAETMTPARAVVCAYEQYTRRNNNTDYDWNQAVVSRSGQTVMCGDWCALTRPKDTTKPIQVGFQVPEGFDTPSETLARAKALIIDALQAELGRGKYSHPADEEDLAIVLALLTES